MYVGIYYIPTKQNKHIKKQHFLCFETLTLDFFPCADV